MFPDRMSSFFLLLVVFPLIDSQVDWNWKEQVDWGTVVQIITSEEGNIYVVNGVGGDNNYLNLTAYNSNNQYLWGSSFYGTQVNIVYCESINAITVFTASSGTPNQVSLLNLDYQTGKYVSYVGLPASSHLQFLDQNIITFIFNGNGGVSSIYSCSTLQQYYSITSSFPAYMQVLENELDDVAIFYQFNNNAYLDNVYGSDNSTTIPFDGSVLVYYSYDTLVYYSSNQLVAVKSTQLSVPLWELSSDPYPSILVSNGSIIYINSPGVSIMCIDISTGVMLWKVTNNLLFNSAVLIDDMIYAAPTTIQYLVIIDSLNGKISDMVSVNPFPSFMVSLGSNDSIAASGGINTNLVYFGVLSV